MDMIGHHGKRGDLHAEESGEGLQAVTNPVLAMIERLLREGIDAREGPAHHPLDAVIDSDLIFDHDLRDSAVPSPGTSRLRCAYPRFDPPATEPRRDGQMYQPRAHVSSTQRDTWVEPHLSETQGIMGGPICPIAEGYMGGPICPFVICIVLGWPHLSLVEEMREKAAWVFSRHVGV